MDERITHNLNKRRERNERVKPSRFLKWHSKPGDIVWVLLKLPLPHSAKCEILTRNRGYWEVTNNRKSKRTQIFYFKLKVLGNGKEIKRSRTPPFWLMHSE